MSLEQSRVTPKYQATIPKRARTALKLKPGEAVTWHVVRGLVFVDIHRKRKNAVKFLASQTRMKRDMVKLVREVRGEIA